MASEAQATQVGFLRWLLYVAATYKINIFLFGSLYLILGAPLQGYGGLNEAAHVQPALCQGSSAEDAGCHGQVEQRAHERLVEGQGTAHSLMLAPFLSSPRFLYFIALAL